MATIKPVCRAAFCGVALWLALSALAVGVRAQPAPSQAITDVDRIVAVVNNDVITQRELDERTDLIQRRLTQTKASAPPEAELRAQVLNQMVLERIQLQRAKEDGITVDDAAVEATIVRLAQNNNLTVDQYRARLAERGVAWDTFKRDARNELILSRLREKEVDARVTVSDAEIANYIASQRGPDAKKSDPGEMTQTHVRHILIRVGGGVSEPAARQQLIDIKKKLQDGGDFATFARTYSQDGSKEQGGDLGWISPGETVPEFERAMNALKDGQISDPIRSEYGYHLIQVLGRREVKGSVKQQQERARQALGARKAEQAYSDWLRELRDTAYVDIRLDPSQTQAQK